MSETVPRYTPYSLAIAAPKPPANSVGWSHWAPGVALRVQLRDGYRPGNRPQQMASKVWPQAGQSKAPTSAARFDNSLKSTLKPTTTGII